MSGLFGARSPSASMNLLLGKRKKGDPGNPGQGTAYVPVGQASPTGKPVTPPRARAKAIKNGEGRNLRVPYG